MKKILISLIYELNRNKQPFSKILNGSMLLNFSNHPSINWSKAQLEAAQQHYGSVQDLPFPQIAPMANTAEVKNLAKDYCALILADYPAVSAVHLMGEMTFIVALVRLLKRKNIKVVCSTTERMVLEEQDGKKTMQFVFQQFREYP